jgi:hypothetical protein
MPEVDYVTIAVITIFTSFFGAIGKEIADYFIEKIKLKRKQNKEK